MSFKERLAEASLSHKSRLVLALDLSVEDQTLLDSALKVIGLVGDEFAALKINYHLLLPLALKDIMCIVKDAHKKGLQTIADLKLNDISSTNLAVLKVLQQAQFDALIVNPIVGYRDALQQTIDEAHKVRMGVIFLTYMSHKGASEGYGLRLKTPSSMKPLYTLFAERAIKWGADGLIVGATKPKIIREVAKLTHNTLPIFSPGVGKQGGSALEALKAGATYLIVGRSILDSPTMLTEARRLREETWLEH
ncbi:MAG: orotidine 5'-phosphate decarboxylase [Nitrososphaerales archaeon]